MVNINDQNRDEIIETYINKLLSDIPRFNLYHYASKYLIKEKSSLNNYELEVEILGIYPGLLENSTKDK